MFMFRTQIYIPEPVHREAKMLAKKRKEPLAMVLRRFIIAGMKEEKKKVKKRSLSSLARLGVKGGPKNLSGNIDKYLYQK